MVTVSEILLASDFSGRSDRPLDRALQLAGQWGSHLVIAHVIERGEGEVSERERARFRSDLPDAAEGAELVLARGSAPKMLAQLATERQSGLVVVGVARFNSIGDYFLGTAVDHILRNVSMPVLIVKRRVRGGYSRIVVATDLSDCSREALLAALDLFPQAHVGLLHVYHVPFEGLHRSDDMKEYALEEARRELGGFLEHPEIAAHRGRIEPLIREGEVANEVARALDDTSADLLVAGTHGRSRLAAALGSQAERLLQTAGTDVLVVRERNGR